MHKINFGDISLLTSWITSLATLNRIAVVLSIIASLVAIGSKIWDRLEKRNGPKG